jgi:tetratricopeptide (TPR) repeat protein
LEVLRRATEELPRATPTLNLAETEMHLGNLKEAIEGYREALRIAGRMPTRETAPLAVWGLAVALDRSGDRVGAEREARFALQLEKSMGMRNLLRSTDVFFVPDYEVLWYEALGEGVRARDATTATEAVRHWRAAEKCLSDYVRDGERAKDRWLDIARARLAAVKAEREKADKKRAKEKPTLGDREDVTL